MDELNKKDLEEILIFYEIFMRICKDDTSWVETNFGVHENKLYIDGCTEYKNEKEKAIVEKLLKGVKKNDK